MAELDEETVLRMTGCRSDFEVVDLLGNIEVDGYKGLTSLKANATDEDAKAHRFEIINAVNAGKHVQLSVMARTFKQRKTHNRRYLRLADDRMAARAPTWKKMPFLLDHDTHRQAQRKGTITSSVLIEESANVFAFEQGLNIVKPDAVISVLDGTISTFSIGWFPLGGVMCSVHECDIRLSDSCGCWPGETVLVDGKPKVVEYIFTDYEGKETSGVNIPAVVGTSISEIQAALAAELNIPTRKRSKEPPTMRFTRLAAALGLTNLEEPDEDRALSAVEALRNRALSAEQEATASRTRLAQAEQALQVATQAGVKVRVDTLIAGAYDTGKLKWDRTDPESPKPSAKEARLRRIAKEDGLDGLAAEIADMDVIVPVGQRLQSEKVREQPRDDQELSSFKGNPFIKSVAVQLGIKPEDMIEFEQNYVQGGD